METTSCTLRTLQQFLKEEGYKQTYAEGEGEFSVVVIPDLDSCEEAEPEFFRDLGFMICIFPDYDDLDDWLEGLYCGGLYTAVAIFIKGRNVTRAFSCNFETFIPNGNQKLDG